MAWHAYRADMRIKTIDTGERVRSHCSYLVNTVELCFCNTLHTYIYFIYARNLQSSCRANVFEKQTEKLDFLFL